MSACFQEMKNRHSVDLRANTNQERFVRLVFLFLVEQSLESLLSNEKK